jgi:hypothetical protein
MKKVFLISLLLTATILHAQKSTVFYVTSVSGNVLRSDKHALTLGDTVIDVKSVKCNNNAVVTLFNAEAGSVQLHAPAGGNSESLFDELCDLFKIKSSRISLSSRGGCDGGTLDDCLKIDTSINSNLLMIDSLIFPEPISNTNAQVKNTFFLQWKCNGKIVNKIIGCNNGHICIKPSDLVNDSINYNNTYGDITLGAIKNSPQGKSYEKLGSFQICYTTTAFVNQYYSSIQQLMKDRSAQETFSRFYTELYVFYGRPDLCNLKNIVHYSE